jgi:hypothetical protein
VPLSFADFQEFEEAKRAGTPHNQALSEISQSQQLSRFTGTPKPSSVNDFDLSFGKDASEQAKQKPPIRDAREDEGNER